MNEEFVKYLITDPEYYSNEVKKFEDTLRSVLEKHKVEIACFRDKISSNYNELAKLFVSICREFNVSKILLNENIELAKELNCGIHLTSTQFDKIKEAKKHDMYVIISCHTLREIEKAQNSFANCITYSPIFNTPNKGEAIGIAKLKEARALYDMNIIALGGILNQVQIDQIKDSKAYGFASIRYFI